MKLVGLNNYKNLYDLILTKIDLYGKNPTQFSTMFGLMFSEEDNVIAETLQGYKIVKTSYGETKEKILRLAASLEKLLEGYPKNSLIGLCMANGLRWIETFWAILLAGYRVLLINYRLPQDILENVIEQNGVRAVFSDSLDFTSCKTYKDEIIGEITERQADSFVFGTEVIFMSSGTQGNVKLCAYTAERFYYQICDTYYILKDCPQICKGYEGQIKQLSLLPFYHIFGFTAVYLWFGFFSRTFVFLKDLSPQTLFNTVRRHKVTHIFAVPLVWETIYKKTLKAIRDKGEEKLNKFEKYVKIAKKNRFGAMLTYKAFSEIREQIFGDSVRFLISGGSGIDTKTIEFFNAIGYHLTNGYGMTELGVTSVELSHCAKDRNSCSVGVPFNNTKYKIEDGHLFVKSKTGATKIICNGSEIDTDFEKWFDTGDLAEEKDGKFFIKGRADDLIVGESGENLNPNLIERLLQGDGIEEICLFRAKDGISTLLIFCPRVYTGDAFIRIKREIENKVIENHLVNEIKRIVFTNSHLRSENDFKISRKKVAENYSKNQYEIILDDRFTNDTLSEWQEGVRDLVARVLQKDSNVIGIEDNFFLDLGGNSLDYFSLISLIKEQLGVAIPMEETQKLSTVQAIAEYIRGEENEL